MSHIKSTSHKSTVTSLMKKSRESKSTTGTTSNSSSSYSTKSLIKTRANLIKCTNLQNRNSTSLSSPQSSGRKPQLKSFQINQPKEKLPRTFEIEFPIEVELEFKNKPVELALKVSQDSETQTWEPVKSLDLVHYMPQTIPWTDSSLFSTPSKSLGSLVELTNEPKIPQKYISEDNLDFLNADLPENLECQDDTDYGVLIQTLFNSISIRYDEDQLSKVDNPKSISDIYSHTNAKKYEKTRMILKDSLRSSRTSSQGTKRKRQDRRESKNSIQNSINLYESSLSTLPASQKYDSMSNVDRLNPEQNYSILSSGYYRVEIPETVTDEQDDTVTVQSVTTATIEPPGTSSTVSGVSFMPASTTFNHTPVTTPSKMEMNSLDMLTPEMSAVVGFKCHRKNRIRLSAHAHRSHRRHRTKRLRLSSAGLINSSQYSSRTNTSGITDDITMISTKSDANTSSSSVKLIYEQINSLGRRFSQISFKSNEHSMSDEKKSAILRLSTTSSAQNDVAMKSASHKSSIKSKSIEREVRSFKSCSSSGDRFQSLLRHKSFLHPNFSSDATSFISGNRPDNLIQEIYEHRTGVNCLELSEDQSMLVSGGEDCVLRIWSTFSTPCECISILVGHLDYITCCAIYKYIVISGSADTNLKIWSIADGNCIKTLKGHSAFINRCITSGPLLLSSSFDCTVRVWSLTDELTLRSFENDRQSVILEFNDEDDKDFDETFSLNDSDSIVSEAELKKLLKRRKPRKADIVKEKKLRTEFGECIHVLEGHSKSVTQVIIISNDPNDGIEQGIIHELNNIVISASIDGTARTWSLATGELRHVLVGHEGPINCLAVDPKDPQIAYTAGADNEIKCWDIITGEHLRDLRGHQGSILCLLAHNRILYSGSSDNTVRAWAMEFGQNTRIYYRSTKSVTVLQFLDGIRSNDSSVRIYDANSAVLKQTFLGHSNAVSAMRVVPGRLFTTSFDGRILVWDCSDVQKQNNDGNLQNGSKVNLSTNIPETSMNESAIGPSLVNTLGFYHQQMLIGNSAPIKRNKIEELYKLYPYLDKKMNSTELEQNHALQDVFRHVFKQRGTINGNKKNVFSLGSLFHPGTKHLNQLWQISTKCLKSKQPKSSFDKPFAISSVEQVFPIAKGEIPEDEKQEDSENVRRAVASLEPYLRTFH